MIFEQRQHDRFSAKSDSYVVFGDKYEKAGRLIDINLQGMAFEYICFADLNYEPVQVAEVLVNKIDDLIFRIYRLRCRIVYDIPTNNRPSFPTNNRASFPFYIDKRCGVEFIGLTEEQASKLMFFIAHHTLQN